MKSARWFVGLGVPLLLGLVLIGIHKYLYIHNAPHRQGAQRDSIFRPQANVNQLEHQNLSQQKSGVSLPPSIVSQPLIQMPKKIGWELLREQRLQKAKEFNKGKPGGPQKKSHEESIFLSIASYRDPECQPTVEDMYSKALRPMSLFIGIVEQHMSDELMCIPPKFLESSCQLNQFCPTDNIQIRRIHPKDAKGPTFGRYLGMLMYRGEKYYMMIDSHNRFATHWDNIVVKMHQGLVASGFPKPVISHYPEPWYNPADGKGNNMPLDGRGTTSYTCVAKFIDSLGYVRFDGFIVAKAKKPRAQPWAAAGFLFTTAKVLSEVPFDPHLDFIFDGEEVLYSVRMWTHGYDIFSPSENILFHYYYRHKAKKFWSLVPPDFSKRQSAAQRRIQWYLKVLKKGTNELKVDQNTTESAVVVDREKYGLGKNRTLEAWYEYAGIDRVNYKVTKNFCQGA